MSKLGINVRIDVTKLDKSKFYKGNKGTYADLTMFVDPANPSQYGDHGPVSQAQTKEEREAGEKMPYIGNAKVFWQGESSTSADDYRKASGGSMARSEDFDQDIPFAPYMKGQVA